MNSIQIVSPVDMDALSNPPEGITVEDTGIQRMHFDADAFSWPIYLISWAGSVPASVLACFIYDAIKKNAKKTPAGISIDETRIRFEKGEITEFIQKKVTYTEKSD